jgi:hypothetical protein
MSAALNTSDEHDVAVVKGLIQHYSELAACYLDNAEYFKRTERPIAEQGYRDLAEHELHREAIARNKLFDLGIVI